MPSMSAQRWFALGKETTRGTPVSPSWYLPIDINPSLEPDVTWLADKGMRGSPGVQYGDVPGYRHDEFSFKGNVFADTFPVLLEALLGNPDSVTGAGPYTHTIGLLNSPTTGSQPPSYTGVDVDYHMQGTSGAKQISDAMLSEITLNFTADGAITYSGKFLSNAFTEVVAPSWSGSNELFIPAWDSILTVNSVGTTVLQSGSITIKRGVDPIQTMGLQSQSPYRLWTGPLDVSGKFVFVAEPNDSWFADALASAYQALLFTFTEPVSSHSIALQMSKVQMKAPKIDSSKAWQQIPVNFTAEMNTTDAVSGGYSAIKTATVNAQSTSY